MERPNHENVQWFIGTEVEHTPAFGMKTLFVVGIQDVVAIKEAYEKQNCEHIFFGANHTYDPKDDDERYEWTFMITPFLKDNIWCTLDIPVSQFEDFHEEAYCEYNNFIPQLRVSIPFVKHWNYNTMLKIDDLDFDATNPGVWTHSLHKLMDRRKFTPWTDYSKDEVIK